MTKITFKFRVNNTLTDATSVVLSNAAGTFGMKRNDTNAVIAADGTAMTKESTGTYTYSFTEPASGLTYTYWPEVTYGGEVYRWELTYQAVPAEGSLITYAEYVNYSGSAIAEARANVLIAAASAAVEAYCDRRFAVSETRTETLSGNGFNYLELDAVPVSITSVTLNPEATVPTTITVGDVAWDARGSLYFRPDASQSTYTVWPEGYRNVRVVYTTASTVPDDVKAAVAYVVQGMEYTLDPDGLVLTKTLGAGTVKWKDPIGLDLDNPIFSHARNLLAPHRRVCCI